MRQRTIQKRVSGVGIGLHSGEPIEITLEPLEENSGIIFYRKDKNQMFKASPENVVNTQMATVIGQNGVSVSTIEHLLGAVYSYGIDNLLISLDAPEVPVMDGSAASYCMLLDEAKIQVQNHTKKVMVITKEVIFEDGEKYVKISPSKEAGYNFKIFFDHPSIGDQSYNFIFSKKDFLDNIAKARTFGFLKDVQYLRSKNLALGGSLENAIVLDDKKILNSEGLRYSNEFVRHKILDAIGDLSLLGFPILGKYDSFAGSHYLNHMLTKQILQEGAFEIKTFEDVAKDGTQLQFLKAFA